MNRHGPFDRWVDGTKVVVLALSSSLTAGIRPGLAADAASPADAPTEEVIITGTSIKRINAETALPVQVLKQEDIAGTGATSVEELTER